MSSIFPTTSYEKQLTELQAFLRGKEYYLALKALHFARELHTGLRKDGVSPEFSHQVFLVNYTRTLLPGIMFPEETLASLFLHDSPEDYDHKVSFDDIESMFNTRIRDAVFALTKKYRGQTVPYPVYFHRIANDPVASIGKGVDRTHNFLTMGDADWTIDKQEDYLLEGNEWFLPMLKLARKNFPEQTSVYENLKSVLLIEAKLIERSLASQKLLMSSAPSLG